MTQERPEAARTEGARRVDYRRRLLLPATKGERTMGKTFVTVVAGAVALALLATGCGGSTNAKNGSATAAQTATTGAAPLASKLPAALKGKTLRVGSDITYPPFESYPPGS